MFRFISFEKVQSFHSHNDDVTICTRDVTTACQEVDLDQPSVLAALDVRAEAEAPT